MKKVNFVTHLKLYLVFITCLLLFSTTAQADTLTVGIGKAYANPSLAAAACKNGDLIEIDPGTYIDDCAVWNANGLVIRGMGVRPSIKAKPRCKNNSLWLIKGDKLTIENCELSNCVQTSGDGAAIRSEGSGLTVRKCFIHNNDNGIASSDNPQSDVKIEFCEISMNGGQKGCGHNVNLNKIRSLKIRGSYIHDAYQGDDIKSGAQSNFILYNRIDDNPLSETSLALDFPNGGACYVVGNLIIKGQKSTNSAFISIGLDGATNLKQSLYLINNTFVNNHRFCTLFKAQGGAFLRIVNNILANVGSQFEASGVLEAGQIGHNLSIKKRDFEKQFVNPAAKDFNLSARSDAKRAGSFAGFADGIDLTPRYEYVENCLLRLRSTGSRDLGAFEAN